MSGYIYKVSEYDILPDEYQIRLLTTRKYEATSFLRGLLGEGRSLSNFQVGRARDGKIDTLTYIDVYEFMEIDLGEVL